MDRIGAILRSVLHVVMLAGAGMLQFAFATQAAAQTGAWPVDVLRPPGAQLQRPLIADVALAGNVAVVAYAGTPESGYRIFANARSGAIWAPATLIVEGAVEDGASVVLDGDEGVIAVGLPDAPGGGRIDLYHLEGDAWVLETSLEGPDGFVRFGETLSVDDGLLVATTSMTALSGTRIESYRRDVMSGTWPHAGYSASAVFIGSQWYASTGGGRIAACLEVLCRTYVSDGAGGWTSEGSIPGGMVPVAVSGSVLVRGYRSGPLEIYRLSGGTWTLQQSIEEGGEFDLSESGLMVRHNDNVVSFYAADGAGMWGVIKQVELPNDGTFSDRFVIGDGWALVGNQSFSREIATWNSRGTVGLRDLSKARYGASLAIARGRLWIGSPGLSFGDTRSGAVWIHSLEGADLPPAGPIVPEQPALLRGFGSALGAEASGHIAIASVEAKWVAQTAQVIVYDGALALPIPSSGAYDFESSGERIAAVDVGLDGQAFALTWKLSTGTSSLAQAFVFNDNGNGFEETQVIDLPFGPVWPDLGYGQRIVMDAGRMVAGMSGFARDTSGTYSSTAIIPRKPEEWPRATGLAANARWVVIPSTDESGTMIAKVFRWNASGGDWQTHFAVRNNGFPIEGGCLVGAIDDDDAIACIVLGTGGRPEIYRAIRPVAGGDWQVVGGGIVPGPSSGYASSFKLVLHDEKAFVGWPDTGSEIAGDSVGRVVVMTFDESIFSSGFD